MQTKRMIGIALAAALVGSMATVAAVSVSAADGFDPTTDTLGIVGSMTDWGSSDDVAMTDPDGDGIYTGVIKDLEAGSYEFKVRTNSEWTETGSWGEYEADYDRTCNSQTNCKVETTETTNLVVSIDTTGDDYVVWPVTYYTYVPQTAYGYFSVIGSINGSWDTDTIMSDEDGDGIYTATIEDVAPGTYEFKVRADGEWTETGSWGVYEADYDRTCNSQTNCSIIVDIETDVTISLDTTGDDYILWPVSYTYYSAEGVKATVYTGKTETPEEPEVPETPEEPEVPETPEEPEVPEEPETPEEPEEPSEEPSAPEYYVTTIGDYIYFDNSETKWDKVCAYWWNTELGETVNVFGQGYGAEWPGVEMKQIPGTDVYQVLVPYSATKIIFNSGVSDEDIKAGVNGYQTADLDYSPETNKGQVYTIDTSVEPTAGRGIEKTKFKYSAGEWTAYAGEFVSEQFGEQPKDDPTADISSTPADDDNSTTTSTAPSTDAPATSTPATGDADMTIVFVMVSAAALGVAVVASKKKEAKN